MSSSSRQRLTVWAGDVKVAMAASAVAEVVREPRVTRMPNGPASLLGVTHLRGVVLPVISLRGLLGGPPSAAERVVVLRRDPPVGLAVDRVEALKATSDGVTPAQDGQLLLDDADGVRWMDLDLALQAEFSALGQGARARIVGGQIVQEQRQAVNEAAYLGFSLAGQDYALPLEAVAEVAPVPGAIAAMPRTEDVLLGAAQRRDVILPILSTRGLLGLPERAASEAERLVVVRVGGQPLGLVVDRVNAILRVAEDRVSPAPSLFNKGQGEARIESVLRMADGRGVVSLLAPERLLADARVSRLLSAAQETEENTVAEPVRAARRERFVVVQLGDERYGLPVAAVDEVVRRPETLTRLPKAPAYVEGLMSLRGRVIPVIDQRQRFSAVGETAGGGRIVVVTIGALQAGFAVDGVASILEVELDVLLPAPAFSADGGSVFDRAVEHEGQVVLLIDPEALLDRAEADLLRDLTATAP